MPYESEKQRRWMHANKPALAARWDRRYGGVVKNTDKETGPGESGLPPDEGKAERKKGRKGGRRFPPEAIQAALAKHAKKGKKKKSLPPWLMEKKK